MSNILSKSKKKYKTQPKKVLLKPKTIKLEDKKTWGSRYNIRGRGSEINKTKWVMYIRN